MRPRKIALILVVVGLVCLPAPLYLGWAAQATSPPPKTSQIYVAQPLDGTNQSDRETLADRHAPLVALSVHQVSEQYSAGEYRAPTETKRTLETAMATGSASTADPAAQADLRAIARNYTFVHEAYSHDEQFYQLRVSENGAAIQARNVSHDRVGRAIIDREAHRYDELTSGEQQTVDRIIANSTDEGYGYRPRVNDPFVDQLPTVVQNDETVYSLFVNGHVDDFGPGFTGFVAGLAVAGVGVILLLIAAILTVMVWWRERSEGGAK